MSKKEVDGNTKIEPASELHLTLAFLGDSSDISGKKSALKKALKSFAKTCHAITGKISGVGLFSNQESDGRRALYASLDAPELPEFRQKLVETINGLDGVKVASNHGFTPHITLAYVDAEESMPQIDLPMEEVTFDKIVLVWGGTHEDIPLG